MPCPQSPEPDGYHRYVLARQGDATAASYTTRCVHCGAAKVQHTVPPLRASVLRTAQRGNAASTAARHAKRED